jgi:hypothetical protein
MGVLVRGAQRNISTAWLLLPYAACDPPFGNALCATDDASELRLNAIERENVATIVRAEHILGCRE